MNDGRDQTDDPIESELRSWFKARGTPAAPPTLRAFADKVGSGSRPTAPVRRLAFGWRQAPGGRLAAAATTIAIVVLAGGLLVISGQRGPAAPTASPLASQPAMASPHATGSPAIATPIEDGGIFGASGLWAVAGGQLYLSSDFGATWGQRTLVPTVALDATSGDVLSSVFVLDANHAWTASPGSGSTVPYGGQGPGYDHLYVVVSRTADGGATWQSLTIPGDWGGTQPVLSFADDQDGYLLLSGLRGGGGSVVFATADGGATWEQVGGAASLGSIFSASDAATLWAGNEGDAGPVARPILDVSRDSGRTWTDARLPGLVGDIFVNDNPVAPPVFSGQDGAVAVIAASTDTSPMVRFYRSSDGGRTWVLAAQVHIGESGSTSVAVVDPLHHVVLDSHTGHLQATSDGGATWQPADLSGLGAVMRLRFWDARDGVAIVQTTNGPAPAAGVLRTTDGGQTWSPVVIAAPSSTAPSPDVTARYPDGIPSTFLGQHVYRPSDLLQAVPTGPFLLGGWDAGTVVSACIPMIEGASNPPCPSFEALAETRGGPMVIRVGWGAFPVPGAPALVLRVTAEPAPTCVSIPPGGCPGPSVIVQDVLWAGDPGTTSPSSSPSPPSSSLPSSGGTCSADQLVVGSATSGFTFGALNYRHAYFTQVVRNDGGDCVLGVPKVIGVGTASGPLVAVSVNNTGNEVCVNSACHYVTPPTYAIRSQQSFEIDFSVSWFVSATDGNGTPLYSAPPCVGGVTDVSRVAFPVASGAIAIDLESASQEAGASVPWHQVCSSPMSISFEIKP